VQYIEISLDGFEKEHDAFRGVPGAWKKACNAIKNCVAAGIETCVATTVTKHNYKDFPKFLKFVETKLKPDKLITFNYVPTRRGKEIAKDDISPEEREKLLELLYRKLTNKKCKMNTFSTAPQYAVTAEQCSAGPAVATHFTNKEAMQALKGRTRTLTEFVGGCGAGRLYCGMEPNGIVFPCVFIPLKIGDIRKQKITQIWDKSSELKKLRDRKAFKGCGDCEHLEICGGCRARAYGYYGDLQGPDPGCRHNMKYWNELKKQK
jgi:radical SAM protein with 4Fe4S-binding SPASM domain